MATASSSSFVPELLYCFNLRQRIASGWIVAIATNNSLLLLTVRWFCDQTDTEKKDKRMLLLEQQGQHTVLSHTHTPLLVLVHKQLIAIFTQALKTMHVRLHMVLRYVSYGKLKAPKFPLSTSFWFKLGDWSKFFYTHSLFAVADLFAKANANTSDHKVWHMCQYLKWKVKWHGKGKKTWRPGSWGLSVCLFVCFANRLTNVPQSPFPFYGFVAILILLLLVHIYVN